mmetsp:Transcript_78509/g.138273  ORF Transcript_78509/g.138273 Transcript_78509/m.138273 type:complete len:1485 (-) Transcript_78509:100-4554(-)
MPQRHEASEPISFGVERELNYTGHLTPASQLVPLPKRVFASADETHIRVWSPAGDMAKMAFPSNRRAMVCSMTFSPLFQTLITGEIDMTMKCYSLEHLTLVESFPLEQARHQFHGKDKSDKRASGKVTSLACLSGNYVLAGSECGCELWHLDKSSSRRSSSVGERGFEFRLGLNLEKQVTSEPVHRIITAFAEQRIFVAGSKMLMVYDLELNLTASCNMPYVCCACIHRFSSSNATLLTGSFEGDVNYWSIQAFDAPDDEPGADGLCTRLEHRFHGHTRAVGMVCFYHRLEKEVRQRIAISCGLDGKLQVWSLETFAKIYTLELSLIDPKAHLFPISQHLFVASYSISGSGSGAEGRSSASVTLMRFTAQIVSPFATTNSSPVVQIAQPPLPRPLKASTNFLSESSIVISEDMAIRVICTTSRQLLSTLPPPPNSKVHILEAFMCPVWQLLILWLSSEEIAIFFVPSQDESKKEGDRNTSTPLLLRRFGIAEVRTQMLDKDLSREAFHSVSLYYGTMRGEDTLLHTTRKKAAAALSAAKPTEEMDEKTWFLLVGTKLGTLQAFKLSDVLGDLPIWPRLASHLPVSAATFAKPVTPRNGADGALKAGEETEGPSKADLRLQQIEQEHLQALEDARAPGQRPFPRGAPPLRLHGRWRHHDYAIEVVKSVGAHVLTIDSKRNLHVCRAEDSPKTIFRFQLVEYACLTPYFLVPEPPEDVLLLSGLVLGTSKGSLESVLLPDLSARPLSGPDEDKEDEDDSGEVIVLSSHSGHGGAVIQVDYLPSSEVFVSIGKDDTVRVWSPQLTSLKEIAFPAPLTAVAFLQLPGSDVSQGHGDILLGFAAHVEQVPFEIWGRSLMDKRKDAGADGSASPSPRTTRSSFLTRTTEDDDSIALDFLHPWDAASQDGTKPGSGKSRTESNFVRRIQEDVDTVRHQEAMAERIRNGVVADFRGPPTIPVGTLSNSAADMVAVEERFARLSHGENEHEHSEVLDQGDFRAITRNYPGYYDWTVNPSSLVDAPREHAIRGVTGEGNVAVVTSVGVGHLRQSRIGFRNRGKKQDEGQAEEEANDDAWDNLTAGSPNNSQFLALGDGQDEAAEEFLLQDSPSAKQNMVASSKASQDQSNSKFTTSKENLRGDVSGENLEQIAEAGLNSRASPAVPSTPRRPAASPPAPRRPYSRPSQAPSSPAVESAQLQSGEKKLPKSVPLTPLWTDGAEVEVIEGEEREEGAEASLGEQEDGAAAAEEEKKESWRNRRIARGVPRHADAPKPTAQNIANTENDVAKMLKERGRLTDAPEETVEINYLSRIGVKKSEWVYCGTDGNLMAARRRAMRGSAGIGVERVVTTWTATGRLRTGLKAPPQQALPSSYLPQPPEHMRHRPPVTRSEVTERRLIHAAMAGYDPEQEKVFTDQDLALESQEFYDAEVREQHRLATELKLKRGNRSDRGMYSRASSTTSSISGSTASASGPRSSGKATDSRVSCEMPRSAR